jgi:hypothetical protein
MQHLPYQLRLAMSVCREVGAVAWGAAAAAAEGQAAAAAGGPYQEPEGWQQQLLRHQQQQGQAVQSYLHLLSYG